MIKESTQLFHCTTIKKNKMQNLHRFALLLTFAIIVLTSCVVVADGTRLMALQSRRGHDGISIRVNVNINSQKNKQHAKQVLQPKKNGGIVLDDMTRNVVDSFNGVVKTEDATEMAEKYLAFADKIRKVRLLEQEL